MSRTGPGRATVGGTTVRLHQLQLPFRFHYAHATTSRSASDSLLLEIEQDSRRGWGEALLRDYVGGLPEGSNLVESASRIVPDLLSRLGGTAWEAVREPLVTIPVKDYERPVLCALEAALLDLECQKSRRDVWEVTGLEPARETIVYGMILPILPEEQARDLVEQSAVARMPTIRIKLSTDPGYNRGVLSMAREVLGDEMDIRVDVNSSWNASAASHLELCLEYGVRIVEDPGSAREMTGLDASLREEFTFVADESFMSESDLETIVRERFFGMLNIRLAKNGGVLRSIQLAGLAEAHGVSYCLGCHVGETGILSSLGRTTASLLPSPRYVDGSFDSYLLVDNVTRRNFGFGPGGVAAVTRGEGVGYEVDPVKVLRYARETVEIPV